VGLAAFRLIRHDPDAIMAVMPSDHVISPDSVFQAAIAAAAELVARSPERIVTFGIKPSYPAEIFGYIERGEPLGEAPNRAADSPLRTFAVRQFREKPKADVARQYLAAGNFFWNAGIFVWRAQTILDSLARHEPEMHAHLQRIAEADGTAAYGATLEREFAAIHGVSIDYAVMERSRDIVVLEAPFGWDDVGSWQAMGRLLPADAAGNVVTGKHRGVNTRGCIVRGADDHLIVTLGLCDTIVVHAGDATLVANKHDEESIRQVVKLLAERGWTQYL
jgi:mannose-1-phosphate guanylyltransferase